MQQPSYNLSANVRQDKRGKVKLHMTSLVFNAYPYVLLLLPHAYVTLCFFILSVIIQLYPCEKGEKN